MPKERSVVGNTKGAVSGVPDGFGIGNVTFARVVNVFGRYCKPLLVDPVRLMPGTVPMVLSTLIKLRSAPS